MAAPDLLQAISAALVTAGKGQIDSDATDWMIYQGYTQEAPNRAITIAEYPGPAPEETVAIDYPDFQVKVRGGEDDQQAARAKALDIYTFLHGIEIAGFVYIYAKTSGPLTLGQDENRRPAFTLNFRTMKSTA